MSSAPLSNTRSSVADMFISWFVSGCMVQEGYFMASRIEPFDRRFDYLMSRLGDIKTCKHGAFFCVTIFRCLNFCHTILF